MNNAGISKTKDAYYFSHDMNARNDPKIMAMRGVYKAEGYGWYWIIVETLAEQSSYMLNHKEWVFSALALSMQCDADTVKQFIERCINDFELFQSDGEYFWSNSLIRRMEKKEENRRKRAEAGKKGAESRWNNSKDMAKPMQTDSNAITEDSKVKEKKVKEKKEKDVLITAQNLSMSEDEYNKLVAKYGKQKVDSKIDYARNYKKLKNYVSLYLTLNNWLKEDMDKHSNNPFL